VNRRGSARTGWTLDFARASARVLSMLSFEIVGYALRSPRDWYINTSKGRDAAEPAAEQLMGGSPLFRGVGKAPSVVNTTMVGVSVWESVVLVIWAGAPSTAFEWDRLERNRRCQRFSVSVTPAAHGMEARWEDADGQLLRHVVILNGELVTNLGDARIFDEHADTDTSLTVREGRLPATTVKRLLAEAGEDEVKTYDGRRYVRTSDPALLHQARIMHIDRRRRTWVAVDQTGKINTLYDPLADLSGRPDPDRLALEVVQAWFGIDLEDDDQAPPVSRYAWPASPDIQGLTPAIRTIQQDQTAFFALLATATFDDVAERVADRYDLHLHDAYDLLKEPLLNLIPHRPTTS